MYIAYQGYDPLQNEVPEKKVPICITKIAAKDGLGEWEEVPKEESFFYKHKVDLIAPIIKEEKRQKAPADVKAFVNAKDSAKPITFNFAKKIIMPK